MLKKDKIKLLFDAEPLALGAKKGFYRSGIYFTALNLLKCFVKHENFKFTLYVSKDNEQDAKSVIKKEFPDEKFEFFVYKDSILKNRLETLLYVIKDENGFFIKILLKTVLHIIKSFRSIIYNFRKYSNHNAVFSAAFAIPETVKELKPGKTCIFLHDVIPHILKEYSHGLSKGCWFQKLTSDLNRKDYYFTNSEHTRKDFLKFYPCIDPEKIRTTYVGCNVPFVPQYEKLDGVKEKYNIPKDKKYLFSLCSLEPRKNLVRAVKTFIRFVNKHNIDDLIYVLGGGNWESFLEVMENTISDLNTDKICQIGYVDDNDLSVLYSGAEWFTYTSQYEGFGSPVLEAMNCGCPVIVSDNSSLPEVVGDAGIKIKWDSDEQHIEAYEKYYFDENLRKENSRKGFKRAKMFSWERTAEKILKEILDNNGE